MHPFYAFDSSARANDMDLATTNAVSSYFHLGFFSLPRSGHGSSDLSPQLLCITLAKPHADRASTPSLATLQPASSTARGPCPSRRARLPAQASSTPTPNMCLRTYITQAKISSTLKTGRSVGPIHHPCRSGTWLMFSQVTSKPRGTLSAHARWRQRTATALSSTVCWMSDSTCTVSRASRSLTCLFVPTTSAAIPTRLRYSLVRSVLS